MSKPNAFYFFMLDFKSKHGRTYTNMKDVAAAAGPHWKNLSKDKKKVYEERAKAARGTEKLNSDRRPVEEIEHMEREEMRYKQSMKDDITTTLATLKRENALKTHLFFIVHINSFCQHDHTKIYSPCEIAIAAFSLQDGVQHSNVFHSMIKPGLVPLGYAAVAQQHSNETHQIDLPTDDEDNQDNIFLQVIEFLSRRKGHSEKLPILYAAEKNIPMVSGVFEDWCTKVDIDPSRFRIYNLQYMFKILRNTVAGRDCWTSDTMSYHEIEKDVYNYASNIACEFHETCDILTFCSRSIAIRYGYTICDNCCEDANIELIPGRHVPEGSMTTPDLSYEIVKSSRKKKSTKYTSDSSSIRDDSSDVDTLISNASARCRNIDRRGDPGQTSSYSTESSAGLATAQGASSSVHATGSYARATTSNIGSSGFSKRPAAMPFNVTEDLNALNLNPESMDAHFPTIGSSMGRGRNTNRNTILKGRGRGNPFQRTTSRS